jgi:DNA-binding CsgD family transcriptional regulator
VVACGSDLAADLRGVVESRVELLLFGTEAGAGSLGTLLEEADADLVIVECPPGEATAPRLAGDLQRHRPGTRLFVLSEVTAPQLEEPGDDDFGSLTARERQVLDLLADGNDLKAISRTLGISLHTTRGHVKNLLSKLDAHSQLEAVVTATRRGYLTAPAAR